MGRLAGKLKRQGPKILITNRCYRGCSGCNQFCNIMPPEKIWDIPLDQLRHNLDLCLRYYQRIHIFGGEPLHHPKWKEIKELFFSYQLKNKAFLVSTAVFKEHQADKNIFYLAGAQHISKRQGWFHPSMVAPCDLYHPRRGDFLDVARRNCGMWIGRNEQCHGIIYDNKVYFCQNAGAMDWLYNIGGGWPLEDNRNPFDRTDKEILEQGRLYCGRCGFIANIDSVGRQYLNKPTKITETNLKALPDTVTAEFEVIPSNQAAKKQNQLKGLKLT